MSGLLEELAEIAASVRMRPAAGIFRLPIDRVFTMKGAGTVITGTVVSGSLQTGEKVECLPQGKTLRPRGLQVHNQPVKEIAAGQRAAINLADIEKEDIHRGDMLTTPGSISPTLMLDVRVNLSERAPKPLAQRTRLRVHHGTKEVMTRIVLLEGETLSPGESALC
ncbi:MAG: selenocysteine-specific translation factor, partial [Armatimonadetes bacterium]|nr:selenocysteine-specific translation factor [Armatimonadota bacterium]NIM23806.1 selenocysteine-specific translation factor [Armatimonadota bacterium]NIM67683.1 selenocysteine-specific translation factor [Armatimonadota bacterium]NIM76195.1 selenocysteine-specific translation factor [Armatimonadota bacterium]NIN05884.1 selenocysteine-specific translation factor [Armatimonadota bacterium]